MRGMRTKAVLTAAVMVTMGLAFTAGSAAQAGAATKPTGALAGYCAQLQQLGEQFGDPGIDAIFEDNPNPTLAQWAAFLPGPIAKLQAFADDIEATDPPRPVAKSVAKVVKRLRAVSTMFDDSRRAAAAGDQKAFDAAGARRDGLVKKMEKAFARVGTTCGFPDAGGE
jgi:hypothetical protein